MPTATEFTALGAGNGFPFCLPSLDVSNRGDGNPYEQWVTLGGTQKGSSPTQGEIDLSLKNAMKIFWNYNGHSVVSLPQNLTVRIDIDSANYTSKSPSGNWTNPLSRVCADDGWDFFRRWTVFQQQGPRASTISAAVVRMYDNNVFLGYGIEFAFFAYSGSSRFTFSSVYRGPDGSNLNSTSKYTSLDGIPFVAIASSISNNRTISISGQTATYSHPTEPSFALVYNNFDFYTY